MKVFVKYNEPVFDCGTASQKLTVLLFIKQYSRSLDPFSIYANKMFGLEFPLSHRFAIRQRLTLASRLQPQEVKDTLAITAAALPTLFCSEIKTRVFDSWGPSRVPAESLPELANFICLCRHLSRGVARLLFRCLTSIHSRGSQAAVAASVSRLPLLHPSSPLRRRTQSQ